MRAIFEAVGPLVGVLGLFGAVWRHRVARRRATNLEHVRELERENREIDEIRERISGKEHH